MQDEERRKPGRPPTQGEPFVKLRANVLPIQAERLATIAAARGVSLSELVREIVGEWIARNADEGVGGGRTDR